MTTLLSSLQDIFELEDPWVEASKKLNQTWVFLQGELEQLYRINGLELVTINQETLVKEVKKLKKTEEFKLEIWLPKTGIYVLPSGGWVYIEKIPKRQWLKSFSETFYKAEYFRGKNDNEKKHIFPQIAKTEKKDIYITENKYIMWRKATIGYIKDTDTIVCTNSNFNQELMDWSKNT